MSRLQLCCTLQLPVHAALKSAFAQATPAAANVQPVLDLQRVIQAIRHEYPCYAQREQRDAHQFYLDFLGLLHDEAVAAPSIDACYDAIADAVMEDVSFVTTTFGSQNVSHTVCQVCNETLSNSQRAMSIVLPVPLPQKLDTTLPSQLVSSHTQRCGHAFYSTFPVPVHCLHYSRFPSV